jgi:hypothetical protein
MWAEVSKLNLLKLVPVLKMPVVIFVGRRDHWVLRPLADSPGLSLNVAHSGR